MIKVSDKSGIDLVFKELNFFRSLPRGLRFGKVFNVIRTLRSIMPFF
jgi:hypothetical protein